MTFHTPFIDIPPLRCAGGSLALPGSKSISNRVLLLAALSAGTTTLQGLLESDDTQVMLDALRELGCGLVRSGTTVAIGGLCGANRLQQARLFLGNAGTAMRPLTAVLAVLGGDYELCGVARMHERPIGDLVDALRAIGCAIDYLEKPGFAPLHIGQPHLRLERPVRVRGDVSSQFLSALLLALPLVAHNDIVIEVQGALISQPYIAITLKLLARFGIDVVNQGWQRFIIPAGSRFKSPTTLAVEADASSASYFIALGAIGAGEGSKIRIEGVGADSIQGDIAFVAAARQMGARIVSGPNWLEVERGRWPLQAIDLDCNHIPDAAMTLAMMALYARGTTRLCNIASWRVKETDRIAAMSHELRKLGAEVGEGADFIAITAPATPADWHAASIATYDDHRMAMCFSLAAFNPARLPVRIQNPACVAKTFPAYFEVLFSVVQARTEDIPVLCIDGPSASGKGTLAAALAKALGYHLLDSGALYRITALAAMQAGLDCDATQAPRLAALVGSLQIRFEADQVWLAGTDVTAAIRSEEVAMNASRVAALGEVRQALLGLQRSFRQLPGLVADGRDMGNVVFVDAGLKVFLTASAEQRAQRRYQQLISSGISATLPALRADMQARDARDSSRSVAPLKPAEDARLLDNSELSIEKSTVLVLQWWQDKQPFNAS